MSERDDADDPVVYEPTAELRPQAEPHIDEGAATQIDAPLDDPLEPSPGEGASFWDRQRETGTRGSKVRQRIEQRRSSEVRGVRGGVPTWVWAAAGLAVLLVVLIVALSGDDGGLTAKDALDTEAGSLDAEGTDLLSLGAGRGKGSGASNEALREFEGKVVAAKGALVQSVLSDDGFWIGTKARRFFVFTMLEGESGPEIRAGDKVSFAAVLRPVPLDFRNRFGLEKDDARRLKGMALYLEVTMPPRVD